MSIGKLLRYEEGYSEVPYMCSENYPTIGIGTRIGPKDAPLGNYTFKVNFPIARAMLKYEMGRKEERLLKEFWYSRQNVDRKTIIMSMAYQLGITGLYKFKKMIAALEVGKYLVASNEELDSKWAKQTPHRAVRHAKVLETGSLDSVKAYEGMLWHP